jgi:hypothetical protein
MPLRLGAAVHVFVSVLILGTLWRLVAYHAMASSNVQVQHIGAAMVTQY